MHFAFSLDRLRAALLQHVQQGPDVTRQVRRDEADACMNFMQSDAAEALRAPIVARERPVIVLDRDLDAVAVPGCKATVETRR